MNLNKIEKVKLIKAIQIILVYKYYNQKHYLRNNINKYYVILDEHTILYRMYSVFKIC